MNQASFRLIIIGAGAISRVAHIPAALASPQIELAGLVDPNIRQAKQVCELYGISPEIAEDVTKLACSFDGAVVATPNDLHAAVALPLIEKEIPLLIEKPMATQWPAAREIADLARAKNVTVAVAYQTRHSESCQTLKDVVDSHHFGKPIRFACQHGSRGGWSPTSGYNLNTQRAGGGVLVSTGTHYLDRLIWLWGMPERLDLQDNGFQGPESHCVARFGFKHDNDTIVGNAVFSKLVDLTEATVVETTEGWLMIVNDATAAVTFRPRANASLEYEVGPRGLAQDPRNLYQRQLEDFVAACRSGGSPRVDAEIGAQSVKLVSALYANRRPLRVDHYNRKKDVENA